MKKNSLLMMLLLILTSCEVPFFGDDDEGSSGSFTSAGLSNGYGGTYTLDLMDDNTFTLKELENDSTSVKWTAEGTYSTLDSGFKVLTITSSDATDGPDAGDAAYGLDISGLVFFLKPMGDGSELIAMVKSGSCPDSHQTLNWLTVDIAESRHLTNGNDDVACDATSGATNGADIFGTFAWDSDTNVAALPTKYDICRNEMGVGDVNGGDPVTCTDGVVSMDGANMFLTESGGAIVAAHSNSDSDDDDEIYLGLPVAELTISALAGNYVGLLFAKDEDEGEDDTHPIAVAVNSEGTMTINGIDPDDGSTEGDIAGTFTLGEANSPSNGFFYGTLNAGSDPDQQDRKVVCMANADVSGSGKNFINCIGQVPNDATKGEMYSILLISK